MYVHYIQGEAYLWYAWKQTDTFAVNPVTPFGKVFPEKEQYNFFLLWNISVDILLKKNIFPEFPWTKS